MLVIRKEQMRFFEDSCRERFETSAIELVRLHQPEDFDRIGEVGVRSLIPAVVQLTRKYDLLRQCDLAGILLFSVALGRDFDTRPEYGWLAAILCNPWLQAEAKIGLALEEWSRRMESDGVEFEGEDSPDESLESEED